MHPRPHSGNLIIDDHSSVRESLTLLLKKHGLAVCGQANGRDETLSFLSMERPDIILVDRSLGEDSALKLVADLRRLDIPVVVCSTPLKIGSFSSIVMKLQASCLIPKKPYGYDDNSSYHNQSRFPTEISWHPNLGLRKNPNTYRTVTGTYNS